MKKLTAVLLSLGIISSILTPSQVQAATIKLNKKTCVINKGSSYRLKIKGTKAKVKWSSSNKKVPAVSSKGVVKGKSAGVAVITAKVKKKKYRCTVTVRKKPTGKLGTKTNPISGYKKTTFNYYEEGKKRGKFTIELLSFASGNESAAMARAADDGKGSINPAPTASQEYLYFKFKFTYISGTQTVSAKDIFNYYYNVFGNNSTKQMTNIDWGFDFEPVDDLKVTDLSPGNQIICAKAILVQKGCGPITYRIQTGKNSYTWFTTA